MKEKIVLTGGVFDILHPGHVFFLNECKKLGGKLVVVVATDATAEKNKKRKPIHPASARALIISSLKMVDDVIIGSDEDKFQVIGRVKPNIIVFGYDQKIGEFEKLRGKKIKLVKLEKHFKKEEFKTSKIIENIRNRSTSS